MLIAIEGIDGSGKRMQTAMLAERAALAGLSAAVYSFPGYTKNLFGKAVGEYLNGKFGGVQAVAPQLAALLYAGDRYATKEALLASVAEHDLVIMDRYVASNMAHQAAKLPPAERGGFIDWISEIEYAIFGLPVADLTIYLDMPVPLAAKCVQLKKQRTYTDKAADIHEQDTAYLQQCGDVYTQLLTRRGAGSWRQVSCSIVGLLREPKAIHEDVWSAMPERLTEPRCNIGRLSF